VGLSVHPFTADFEVESQCPIFSPFPTFPRFWHSLVTNPRASQVFVSNVATDHIPAHEFVPRIIHADCSLARVHPRMPFIDFLVNPNSYKFILHWPIVCFVCTIFTSLLSNSIHCMVAIIFLNWGTSLFFFRQINYFHFYMQTKRDDLRGFLISHILHLPNFFGTQTGLFEV